MTGFHGRRAQPADQSATLRRQFRMAVRNILGPGSDSPPEVLRVLRAAVALDHLLVAASNGRYHLRVVHAAVAGHPSTRGIERAGDVLAREKELDP